MNISEFFDVLKKGESETVEFKQSFNVDTIETLSAFANVKGGSVLIGVKDNGEIIGVQLKKEMIKNWVNEIKNKTYPAIIPEVDELFVDGKSIVVLSINDYPIKPVAVKSKYFKRVSSSNLRMDLSDISNLYLKTFNQSWDYYKDANHSIDDISYEKVEAFIDAYNKIRLSKIEDDSIGVLHKYELLRENFITNACYLLFAKSDVFLSTIEMGRFSDEITIKDSKTLRTDLFTEVEEILEFVRKHINKRYIITGKAQR